MGVFPTPPMTRYWTSCFTVSYLWVPNSTPKPLQIYSMDFHRGQEGSVLNNYLWLASPLQRRTPPACRSLGNACLLSREALNTRPTHLSSIAQLPKNFSSYYRWCGGMRKGRSCLLWLLGCPELLLCWVRVHGLLCSLLNIAVKKGDCRQSVGMGVSFSLLAIAPVALRSQRHVWMSRRLPSAGQGTSSNYSGKTKEPNTFLSLTFYF